MSEPIILVNTLADPDARGAVARAVADTLAVRTGEWLVSLLEGRDDRVPSWEVIVAGPGIRRSWTFEGGLQDAAIVRATLEGGLEHIGLPLGWQTVVS